MKVQENVRPLVAEYQSLFAGIDLGKQHGVAEVLSREGEWTPLAAEHLLCLVRKYGSFMLRNALAISIALGIEDGELGF